jgi:hypothetical protein
MHLVTYTFDNNYAKLYVDGKEVDSVEITEPIRSIDNPDSINIGGYDGGDRFSFEGTIDGVAVYNQALSPVEVEAIYNSGAGSVVASAGTLAIEDIVDESGDYSSVVMSGTGIHDGDTINLYDESGSIVATTQVDKDGNWSLDISDLENTGVNDNEFFKVVELDSNAQEIAQTDVTQYWHGYWSNAATEVSDDFALMGAGNDKITLNNDDLNDSVVIDGGDGNDKVRLRGESEYDLSQDDEGDMIITESASSDSDNDGVGDVNEIRNVETIDFGNGDDKLTLSENLHLDSTTIDAGSGFDTLVLENENIDLSGLSDNIKNIEAVDLGGMTQNISLSVEDVLDLTDRDNTLRIDGSEDDTLSLDTTKDGSGEWKLGDFQVTDSQTGATYDVYTNEDSSVTIEVNTDIQVDQN